jgi:hypothetical protein
VGLDVFTACVVVLEDAVVPRAFVRCRQEAEATGPE